jgi:hypothetical protein
MQLQITNALWWNHRTLQALWSNSIKLIFRESNPMRALFCGTASIEMVDLWNRFEISSWGFISCIASTLTATGELRTTTPMLFFVIYSS